jgi:prepilin-type N-terminal cleavage/methylation domain-containing protein
MMGAAFSGTSLPPHYPGGESGMSRKGFTLIELMIVVVIIGILAAIAIPKFQNVQDSARRSTCLSNMRCLATAESMYYGEWNTFTADWNELNTMQDNASILECPQDNVGYALAVPTADDYTVTCASGVSHGSVENGITSWQ